MNIADPPSHEAGLALHRAGRLQEAEAMYRKVLELAPNLDTRHALALLYNQTGRNAEAIPLLESVLAEDPGAESTRLVLARCLAATDRLAEAIRCCEEALANLPGHPVALNLAGQLRQQSGEPAAAMRYLESAVAADPAHGPAWHNLGVTRASSGDHPGAIEAYQKALEIMPAAARVMYNLGLALESIGLEQEALEQFRRALALKPGLTDARLRALQIDLASCEWRHLDQEMQTLEVSLQNLLRLDSIAHLSLHVLNLLTLPATLHRELARRVARGVEQRARSVEAPTRGSTSDRDRIRIAYLSPDLGAHAVGGLLGNLFATHDRHRVEVYVYSLRHFDDAIATTIRAGADVFRDLAGLSISESAAMIAADAPDILVDLGGYTQGARTELVALRLAPVQVSWLGYLNTMGAPFIDYLVADDTVVPEAAESEYDEAIARLPGCFLPPSDLAVSERPVTRQDAGLPADSFVFASFNNPVKIQPRTFRAWVRILRAVPDSVLWCYDGGRKITRRNLRHAFEVAGLDPGRLVFAPRVTMDEHMTRLVLADLFLDTFDYNAGATAVAAMQAGLPLLTRPGPRLLGRMGASLASSAGVLELVAEDTDDYVRRAVHLAQNPGKLATLRERLCSARAARRGHFDLVAFTRALEALFEEMMTRHREGLPPAALQISAPQGRAGPAG